MSTRKSVALIAVTFAVAACSNGGSDNSVTAAEQMEANLDAENFDATITSDEAVLNESEAQQLNVATQ